MLQHVIEIKIFNLVLGGVDLVVRVLEVAFDDEGGWVASFGGRCMVAACQEKGLAFGRLLCESGSSSVLHAYPHFARTNGIVQY